MERDKVRELIEQYREDGYPVIDVCLNDERSIKILQNDNINYFTGRIRISNINLVCYIEYSFIKEVAI